MSAAAEMTREGTVEDPDLDTVLKVRNIETFYGPIMAIRGVSLAVKEGAVVTVLGANGAGKTTILRTISGVMSPRKGTVEFLGKRIDGIEPNKVVDLGIGHSPEGREVFPLLSVTENLHMGAYLRTDADAVARDIEAMHAYFPILKERASDPAGLLSGGQQQMLAIARAMMSRPKLLMMDEPSLGLSPRLVKDIFGIIRRINDERGTTILLVEQNAKMALEAADFGYVLEVGRIVMEGPAAELLAKEDIQEFYLGVKEEGVRGQRRWKKKKMWR